MTTVIFFYIDVVSMTSMKLFSFSFSLKQQQQKTQRTMKYQCLKVIWKSNLSRLISYSMKWNEMNKEHQRKPFNLIPVNWRDDVLRTYWLNQFEIICSRVAKDWFCTARIYRQELNLHNASQYLNALFDLWQRFMDFIEKVHQMHFWRCAFHRMQNVFELKWQ